MLTINQPTEKQIQAVLKNIVASEQIDSGHINDQHLKEIRMICQRDLRSAIMTLQFKAAGKSYQTIYSSNKKLKLPNSQTSIPS